MATSLDRPTGYIQRVALASSSASSSSAPAWATWATWPTSSHYRSLLLLLVFSVQLNDMFAYVVGKSIGGPKLAPQTSPNKTISGSLGAIVLTTLLVFGLSGLVFREGR